MRKRTATTLMIFQLTALAGCSQGNEYEEKNHAIKEIGASHSQGAIEKRSQEYSNGCTKYYYDRFGDGQKRLEAIACGNNSTPNDS